MSLCDTCCGACCVGVGGGDAVVAVGRSVAAVSGGGGDAVAFAVGISSVAGGGGISTFAADAAICCAEGSCFGASVLVDDPENK